MSLTPNGNGNIWPRLALVLVPLIIAAAVAGITIKADVSNLKAAMAEKASRDVVQAQYESILRELQDIKRRLP